eukprot:GHVU01109803.1.p3 GENE.GHVU01109803.1~~GHVU01109803.1.p3  ORF type:complete len:106 (-),score=0.38 GHVU01109803.1:188-505(-)
MLRIAITPVSHSHLIMPPILQRIHLLSILRERSEVAQHQKGCLARPKINLFNPQNASEILNGNPHGLGLPLQKKGCRVQTELRRNYPERAFRRATDECRRGPDLG